MTANFAVEFVPWEDFISMFAWQQGEHVSCVGPTGTGKTNLAIQLLPPIHPARTFVAALATKRRDATLSKLQRGSGYKKAPGLPSEGREASRVLIWPRGKDSVATRRAQAATFRKVLRDAYDAGSWTIFADELAYLIRLGLKDELLDLWQQGRAVDISVVGCTQRPRYVPLDMYSAATHLFLWRTNDDQDLRRISGLNGADSRVVRAVVEQLNRYEVLYVDTRTGSMSITLPPKL